MGAVHWPLSYFHENFKFNTGCFAIADFARPLVGFQNFGQSSNRLPPKSGPIMLRPVMFSQVIRAANIKAQ
jgi:hypothetical protein